MAGAVTAAVLAAVVVPEVREELARSFTRQDRPYAELYFIELPSQAGTRLRARVAFTPHGAMPAAEPSAKDRAEGAPRPGPDSFVLKAEAARDGEHLATGWARVRAVDGRAGVVDMTVPGAGDADELRVSVAGRPEYIVGHLDTNG
ncbi:hypothetical protein [Streptomyces koelreuteriae]|uniref:hypothetical protein n=1 Tax=Streptomyces koelreuteriae TaxID=2838015 RepID=UPI003EBEC52F